MRGSLSRSPQRGVVELDSEQVAHADLGGVVNDVLVVEEGVGPGLAHARLHRRANGHREAVPEGERDGGGRERWERERERDGGGRERDNTKGVDSEAYQCTD